MTDSGSDNLRDELLELLMSSQHAPRDTHHGETGECLQCPWPLHALPPDDIADVLTAEVERRVAEAVNTYRNEVSDDLRAKSETFRMRAEDAKWADGGFMSLVERLTAASILEQVIGALASGQEGN